MEGATIDSLVERLRTSELVHFSYAGFEIEASLEGERLALLTPVFQGGNYIPPSVRRCLNGRSALSAHDPRSEVRLWIDQERFQVVLDYKVKGGLTEFAPVFEEFFGVADEWRTLLDEYGQQDLIHVSVS